MTVHLHTEPRDLHVPADHVAGNGTTGPAPVSTRAAFAVLGSMIFLILALTVAPGGEHLGTCPEHCTERSRRCITTGWELAESVRIPRLLVSAVLLAAGRPIRGGGDSRTAQGVLSPGFGGNWRHAQGADDRGGLSGAEVGDPGRLPRVGIPLDARPPPGGGGVRGDRLRPRVLRRQSAHSPRPSPSSGRCG